MPQTIDIPEVGLVEFPDGLDDKQILKAIEDDIIPQHRRERFAASPSGRASRPSLGIGGSITYDTPAPERSTLPGTFGRAATADTLMAGEAERIAPPVLSPEEVEAADTELGEIMREPVGGAFSPEIKSRLSNTLAGSFRGSIIGSRFDPDFVRGLADEAIDIEETMRTPGGVATLGALSLGGTPGLIAKGIFSGIMTKEFGKTLGELDVASKDGDHYESGKLAMRGLATGTGGFGLIPGMVKTARTPRTRTPPLLEPPSIAPLRDLAAQVESPLPLSKAALAGSRELFQPAAKPLQTSVETAPAQVPAPEGMVKSQASWRDLFPKEIQLQADATILEAVENIKLARQRAAERGAGSKLEPGEPAKSVAETPGALQTAEQRLSQREPPSEPIRVIEEVTMDTPLKDVEQIVREKLEQADWLSAVEVLGQAKAETSAKVIDTLLGVGRDSVPLSAASKTIFYAIWGETVKMLGGEPKPATPRLAEPTGVERGPATTKDVLGKPSASEVKAEEAGGKSLGWELFSVAFNPNKNHYEINPIGAPREGVSFIDPKTKSVYFGSIHSDIYEAVRINEGRRLVANDVLNGFYKDGSFVDRTPQRNVVNLESLTPAKPTVPPGIEPGPATTADVLGKPPVLEVKAEAPKGAKRGVSLKVQNPYGLAPENEKILTVTGDIIKLNAVPALDFFIYKSSRSGYWTVVEKNTGQGLGGINEKTRAAAIAKAEEKVGQVGPQKMQQYVNEAAWMNAEKPTSVSPTVEAPKAAAAEPPAATGATAPPVEPPPSGILPGVGANPIPQIARAIFSTTHDARQWLRTHVRERIGPNDLPVMRFRRGQLLPDFQSPEVSGRIFNAPHNLGNIPGLGMIFDARARALTPQEQAIIQRQAELHIGKNIAGLIARQFGTGERNVPLSMGAADPHAIPSGFVKRFTGTIDSAFELGPKTSSQIKNITTTKPGQSTYISDFLEGLQRDPNSYELTPRQREAAQLALDVNDQITALADRNGVGRFTDNEAVWEAQEGPSKAAEPYFTRIRIDKPEGGGGGSLGGARPGSKPWFDKGRFYETEQAGAEPKPGETRKPVTYEPSIEKRLIARAAKVYQKIADKRLAENPSLAGETGREPLFGEGRIQLPAFQGRVYPLEVVERVNRFYNAQGEGCRLRRSMVFVNSMSKGTSFGLDLGAMFLQGLPMFLDPTKTHLWAKSAYQSLKALGSDQVMTRYLKDNDNLIAARELAQMNVSLGPLTDFMAGLQEGHFLGKFPGYKQARQSFETFLGTAAIELWKAHRDTVPKEQWPRVAESLQNILMHGRMQEAGMPHGQALLEQSLLLAPSYLRGATGLLAGVTESGRSGQIARRTLTRMALGGTMLFYYMANKAGLDNDQILQRMNPADSRFLSVPVKFKDGRIREIGFGGAVKSIVSFLAKGVDATIQGFANDDWSKFGTGADKNILMRFMRGKAAPVPGFVFDVAHGTDFLGNDVDWTQAWAARTLPLAVQTVIKRPGEPDAVAGDVVPGFLGLSIFPESVRSQFTLEREASARELYKKPYESLDVMEQLDITQATQRKPPFSVKEPTSDKMRKLAAEAEAKRRTRITKALPKEVADAMTKLQLVPLVYDASLSFNKGVTLLLTDDQVKAYEKLIVESYAKHLPDLLADKDFQSLTPDRRQELANKVMATAKKEARSALLLQLDKRQP